MEKKPVHDVGRGAPFNRINQTASITWWSPTTTHKVKPKFQIDMLLLKWQDSICQACELNAHREAFFFIVHSLALPPEHQAVTHFKLNWAQTIVGWHAFISRYVDAPCVWTFPSKCDVSGAQSKAVPWRPLWPAGKEKNNNKLFAFYYFFKMGEFKVFNLDLM